MCTVPLFLAASALGTGENTGWKSWVKVKAGRLLINYFSGQKRLGKNECHLLLIKINLHSEKQTQELKHHLSPPIHTGGSVEVCSTMKHLLSSSSSTLAFLYVVSHSAFVPYTSICLVFCRFKNMFHKRSHQLH